MNCALDGMQSNKWKDQKRMILNNTMMYWHERSLSLACRTLSQSHPFMTSDHQPRFGNTLKFLGFVVVKGIVLGRIAFIVCYFMDRSYMLMIRIAMSSQQTNKAL